MWTRLRQIAENRPAITATSIEHGLRFRGLVSDPISSLSQNGFCGACAANGKLVIWHRAMIDTQLSCPYLTAAEFEPLVVEM